SNRLAPGAQPVNNAANPGQAQATVGYVASEAAAAADRFRRSTIIVLRRPDGFYEADFRKIFARHGTVKAVWMGDFKKNKGAWWRAGAILYDNQQDAEDLVLLRNVWIGDKQHRVQLLADCEDSIFRPE
ncbi:hypothetical protein PMAYCL1PPCAC_28201, partial [Pristionchus mayeri]